MTSRRTRSASLACWKPWQSGRPPRDQFGSGVDVLSGPGKIFSSAQSLLAHNILENITTEGSWANIVCLTYFNAGLRAVDLSDVLRPKEIGCHGPELSDGQDAIQSNGIGADAHGRIYLIDRAGAGMHILEYTG
jgi:hypothetical protein